MLNCAPIAALKVLSISQCKMWLIFPAAHYLITEHIFGIIINSWQHGILLFHKIPGKPLGVQQWECLLLFTVPTWQSWGTEEEEATKPLSLDVGALCSSRGTASALGTHNPLGYNAESSQWEPHGAFLSADLQKVASVLDMCRAWDVFTLQPFKYNSTEIPS